jgi:hypothetical protein
MRRVWRYSEFLPTFERTSKQALAELVRIDAAKEIRDKAVAFEVYARQANNVDAERKACGIRLRAERKCGQLLSQMEKWFSRHRFSHAVASAGLYTWRPTGQRTKPCGFSAQYAREGADMAKRGRPGIYSPEIAAEICERMAMGESLRSICRAEGMPAEATARLWAIEDREGFSSQYAMASQIRMDCLADEILEIADNESGDPARDRLRLDIRNAIWSGRRLSGQSGLSRYELLWERILSRNEDRCRHVQSGTPP